MGLADSASCKLANVAQPAARRRSREGVNRRRSDLPATKGKKVNDFKKQRNESDFKLKITKLSRMS